MAGKRKEGNFTIISNDVFNSGLSNKTKGLMCHMLSLPKGWKFSVAGLCAICPRDGRDSISSSLKELENAGFLVRTQRRNADGTLAGIEWTISDTPSVEKPSAEKPKTEEPLMEKPQLSNTYSNKDISKQELREGRTPTRSRFVPPSVEEVQAYCRKRRNNVDAQRFVDYYAVSGWKRGKTPIRDWRACVRTWERQGKQTSQKASEPDYAAFQEESL